MREELKNKNTIINILLENIFSNNKSFSSYEKLEDNYKNNVQRNQFETPKRYSFKNSHKTQDNEINITQDMKLSVTQMKMIQGDATMIMTNYLVMSRQAYHHGKS